MFVNVITMGGKDYAFQTKDLADAIELAEEYARTYPLFKLRANCSRLIHHALKDKKNNLSILKFLPYTVEELKRYLESKFDSKMSWDNYGSYWHIDHIVPQSKLPYNSMNDENFIKCWSLSNLQPLEAIQNMKKGAR